MAVIRKQTATCYFVNSGTERNFPSVEDARTFAENYVGNRSCNKPFPNEDTYMYGPGDGTTSVMVRRDIEFTSDMHDSLEAPNGEKAG